MSSENAPSSNTSRNSHPSGPNPWIECGSPAGKNHRSPSPTSSTKFRPFSSTSVTRAVPFSISAHSLALCQCSSRIVPASSRMFTPAISLEIGSSRIVVSRVHPPGCSRMWLSANDHFMFGTDPRSVRGGAIRSGFWRSSGTLRGPSTDAPTPVACGCGSPCARATVLAPLAKVAATRVRRDKRSMSIP